MAQRFTLREPKLRGFVPETPFGLYENGIPLVEIFRLLKGSVDVWDKKTSQTVKLTSNETGVGALRSARPVHIYDYLLSRTDGEERASFAEFTVAVERQKHLNRDFFESLRAELILCIVAKKRARYTESFLCFYRILEHISLAFPLTYVLHESDFSKAHAFLTDLYQQENARDLSAMKSFVPKIARRGGYENEAFTFLFGAASVEDARECVRQLKKCFPPDGGVIVYPDDDTSLEFSVAFNKMHAFIVTFRNRMFHNRAGELNFKLSKFGGSDVLCQVVMSQALHWFSKIYGEIVRTLLAREL